VTALQRVVGRLTDFRVGIIQQQDEDVQLLAGARRQSALRRQHSHIARRFAASEEIVKRTGVHIDKQDKVLWVRSNKVLGVIT
jgi:hypothetical protein